MSTLTRQWSTVAVRAPRLSALQLAFLLVALMALVLLAGAALEHLSALGSSDGHSLLAGRCRTCA